MSDTEPGGPYDPPTTSPGVDAATAGLGIRFGARLLDVLIVGIPSAIVLGLIGVSGFAGSIVISLLWFGYFVYLESSQGATIGKKLLNLRVIGTDGAFPSMEVAAKRNIWMLFGVIPILGSLLSLIAVIVIAVTISSAPDNRGYHDTFAGTRVLR
jgi:uncharacterized RDD family membrane protein YckC